MMARLNKQKVRLIVGLFTGAGFFGLLYIMSRFPIPVDNTGVLQTLAGALGGSFITIISFYFGDSDGKDNDKPGEQ